MEEITIGIICGHGYNDPGATGYGYTEKELVREFAPYVVKHFNRISNVKCILLNKDNDVYKDRNMSELSKKCDHTIELHANAVDDTSVRGTETLIWIGHDDAIDRACRDALGKFFKQRGFKDGTWLLNWKTCDPNCSYRLLELFFISNKDDIDNFRLNMEDIAIAMAKEVAVALNQSYDSSYEQNMAVSIDFQKDHYYNPSAPRYRMKALSDVIVCKDFDLITPFTYTTDKGDKRNSTIKKGTYINSNYAGVNKYGDKVHVQYNQHGNKIYFAYKEKI